MATIPNTELKNLFTKTLVAVYNERPVATSFLRSFFKNKETISKYISIEVRRGTEKVAVDVNRASKGNRNTFDKSTETVILPPYFREYFDLTAMSVYDNVFGSDGEVGAYSFALLVESVREKMNALIDKIERAYELQCAQILQTGIVTLVNGDNISFNRKAGSMVDKATLTPWSTASVDPIAHITEGLKFIREEGKHSGANLNVILGGAAMNALMNNETFQKKYDIKNITLGAINEPQRNALGASFQGRVSAGSYTVDLWTYPQVYENEAGAKVPYINESNVVIVPETPEFVMAYAGVPALVNGKPMPVKGMYHFGEYQDERNFNVDYDVRSAGIPVPVAIDQIYTMKVL